MTKYKVISVTCLNLLNKINFTCSLECVTPIGAYSHLILRDHGLSACWEQAQCNLRAGGPRVISSLLEGGRNAKRSEGWGGSIASFILRPISLQKESAFLQRQIYSCPPPCKRMDFHLTVVNPILPLWAKGREAHWEERQEGGYEPLFSLYLLWSLRKLTLVHKNVALPFLHWKSEVYNAYRDQIHS